MRTARPTTSAPHEADRRRRPARAQGRAATAAAPARRRRSDLLVVLAEQLRDDGYDVATARDGVEALRRLEGGWPDLAIIDMMMPRIDGLSLAREIKARADLPIIVLSAIDAADSKAELLDEVAEDYVTKPYHYPELRARINRVLRRLGDRLPGQRVVVGPALVLELHRRTATVNGVAVVLTPIESRLLYALAANLGQTISTETLLLRGWADTEDADPSYVWVTMRRLRTRSSRSTRTTPATSSRSAASATAWRSSRRERERLRVRITIAVMVAALLPVSVFGLLLVASGSTGATTLVLIALVVAALVGLAVGGLLVGMVVGPLRALETRLARITAGERVEPLGQLPDDELGRLAERQEDLAADLARRNRQVARAVDAITAWAPADGATVLLERAATDAREALGLIDARIVLGDPDTIEIEERVPGEPRPVSADLLSGREVAGVLLGHAPATMRWEPADQDLLELFAASVAVALRDAELLARVERAERAPRGPRRREG